MKSDEIEKIGISCDKFPEECNDKSCTRFPCDEIKFSFSEKIKIERYYSSYLTEWLELDTWFVLDALLLLSGISPSGADVDFTGYKNFMGIWINDVKIRNVQPLDENDYFYIIPFDRETIKDEGWEKNEEIINKEKMLATLEIKFRKIKRLWDSRKENWMNSHDYPQERNPIRYYINWAKEKKITIPWLNWAIEHKLYIDYIENDDAPISKNILPYLDKKHNFYAKELQIAVEAWTALYEKQPPTQVPKGGHKNYINRWLQENYPELGQRAIERISTVINPNPKGGASPTF